MLGLDDAKGVGAGFDTFVSLQDAGRTIGKIAMLVRANETAYRFGVRRDAQPVVQGSAFVGSNG